MKIAIYGGTFDPPHMGHLKAAQDVIAQICPEKLLIVPTFNPPHKFLTSDSPSARARLEMSRLFAECIPCAELCDIELNREGKSYTADTLELLKAEYPDDELLLLMGTDMIMTFDQWYNFRRIIELATLVVFARDNDEDESIMRQVDLAASKYGARITFVRREPLPLSSTELRTLLKRRAGAQLVPDAVYGYIIKHRLYGAKPEFQWLRERAYAHLKPKRIPHVQGTEQEAIRLAERWGADVENAAEAAILHDITKKLSHDEQLLLCSKYGIMTDSVESVSPKLLHSKTGAALSRDLFGVNDAVCDAIMYHTTGKPDMSILEKIVYIADYIEPNRSFDGVEALRELAYRDIDEAVISGLQMSLEEVAQKGTRPHQRTVDALNFLLKKQED